MTAPLRSVIVDDEPLARRLLRSLLAQDGGVEVVAEAGNGREALSAIARHRPHLVFLDVQLPGLDGFEIAEALEARAVEGMERPAIIFVTAYDQYALRAFDVHALDYLLKPFDGERLSKAVRRARDQLGRGGSGELDHRVVSLLEELRTRERFAERLVVKTDGRIRFVAVDDVDWIEADRKVLRIHSGKQIYVVRDSMNGIAERLDPRRFLRIHRSTIVNVDRIEELQPWFQGDYVLILRDGTKLTSGRVYRDAVQQLIRR